MQRRAAGQDGESLANARLWLAFALMLFYVTATGLLVMRLVGLIVFVAMTRPPGGR